MNKLMDLYNSASWKTSLSGLGTLLAGLGVLGNMIKTNNYGDANLWGVVISSITGGVGLIFAKDKNVTGAPPRDVAK